MKKVPPDLILILFNNLFHWQIALWFTAKNLIVWDSVHAMRAGCRESYFRSLMFIIKGDAWTKDLSCWSPFLSKVWFIMKHFIIILKHTRFGFQLEKMVKFESESDFRTLDLKKMRYWSFQLLYDVISP